MSSDDERPASRQPLVASSPSDACIEASDNNESAEGGLVDVTTDTNNASPTSPIPSSPAVITSAAAAAAAGGGGKELDASPVVIDVIPVALLVPVTGFLSSPPSPQLVMTSVAADSDDRDDAVPSESPLHPTAVTTTTSSAVEVEPEEAASLRQRQMYARFQSWALRNYGESGKTKTVTRAKYERVVAVLDGREPATADNSKLRFWIKAKGFRLGCYDDLLGTDAVESTKELYIPSKTWNGNRTPEEQTDMSMVTTCRYKKVAIVEDFFDIIYNVHVEMDGRGGKHAGQKRTYRAIAETYAFLPREAVTKFLMSCADCQKRMHLTMDCYGTVHAKQPMDGGKGSGIGGVDCGGTAEDGVDDDYYNSTTTTTTTTTGHKSSRRTEGQLAITDYNLPITVSYLNYLKQRKKRRSRTTSSSGLRKRSRLHGAVNADSVSQQSSYQWIQDSFQQDGIPDQQLADDTRQSTVPPNEGVLPTYDHPVSSGDSGVKTLSDAEIDVDDDEQMQQQQQQRQHVVVVVDGDDDNNSFVNRPIDLSGYSVAPSSECVDTKFNDNNNGTSVVSRSVSAMSHESAVPVGCCVGTVPFEHDTVSLKEELCRSAPDNSYGKDDDIKKKSSWLTTAFSEYCWNDHRRANMNSSTEPSRLNQQQRHRSTSSSSSSATTSSSPPSPRPASGIKSTTTPALQLHPSSAASSVVGFDIVAFQEAIALAAAAAAAGSTILPPPFFSRLPPPAPLPPVDVGLLPRFDARCPASSCLSTSPFSGRGVSVAAGCGPPSWLSGIQQQRQQQDALLAATSRCNFVASSAQMSASNRSCDTLSRHSTSTPCHSLGRLTPGITSCVQRQQQQSPPYGSAGFFHPVLFSGPPTDGLAAIRQIIAGYRDSAAFLCHSADELEMLLSQQQQQQSVN